MSKKSLIPYEFNPGISHYLYFIRKGLLKAILANKKHIEGGRLLDFGCGSKPYKSIISVSEYIGLDFDGEGHSHVNEEIDVFYDGKNIPFPDAHFDSILTTEVFEHVFEPHLILSEWSRVLKPGGKVLLTCPFVFMEHEVPVDYARYTQYSLKYLFEAHGFDIITYSKSGNFVTTIFQTWITYLMRLFLLRRFKTIVVPLVTISGLFFNWLLPKRYDLYLNNIVIAQKRG